MMRVPYIMGVISRIHAPGNLLCQYYGLGITGRVVGNILGRAGQYDIFDGTRSLVPGSAPGAPPIQINRKPVGSIPITVPRLSYAIGIEDEQIFGTRRLGANASAPVDDGGKQYMANQLQYAKQRLNNSHEFMASRMFAGGWGMKATAGSQLLQFTEVGTSGNSYENLTRIPSVHKNQITENGTSIITDSWDNPGADILTQLMNLQKRAARVNGRRITEIWMNATTATPLFTNSVLQGIGGAVYKIWDTLNPTTEIGPNQKFPDTGVTVQFRALPDYKFHIYNQGYVLPGTSEDFASQIDATKWMPFIPDNVAIMTPSPGEWCGMVQGSERMQWNLLQGGSQTIFGFGMGTERSINPPKTDIKFLYNGAPVITEPYSCYYATVIFTGAPS